MAGARHPLLARLHAWIGVILAVPLGLVALSGAMLLFRDALFVPDAWQRAAPAVAPDAEVARLLALPPLRAVESIQVARGLRDFHVVSGADGATAWWRVAADAPVPQAEVPWRLRFEPALLEFHEHLLLGATGDVLVRILGPLAAFAIGLGLFLWWPLRRGWRRRDLLVRGDGRPQLLRSHLALGAATGLLLLVHATTGAMMANNPSIRAWLKPLADARASQWPAGMAETRFAPADAAAALAAVRRLFPAGEITQLAPQGDAGTGWSLKLRLPGEDHPNGRSSVTLDLASGRLLALRDARLAGLPGGYDDVVFPLHVGTLFDPWQRWLWLLGAVALARLVLLGGLSYWRRGRRAAPA